MDRMFMQARTSNRFSVFMLVMLAASSMLAACGEQHEGGKPQLAITGTYHDNFNCTQVIDSETWTTVVDVPNSCGGIFHIADYSNSDLFLIAQNDATNTFDPNLWSRFDWVTKANHLYYCQTAFDKTTQAIATATPRSDDSNPAATGCGGSFSWTQLN